jgi:OPT family oligopeptide transporter
MLLLSARRDIGILITYVGMASVYYGNAWNGLDFPFMSQSIFDTEGYKYNQTALLTDGKFDQAKYDVIGPARFSATNALFLMVNNLSIGAALVHVALWHHQDISILFKGISFGGVKARFTNGWRYFLWGSGEEDNSNVTDEHYLQMLKYKPIPRWWFSLILVGAFAMAQATNYAGKSGTPWWTLIIILLIAFVFTTVYAFLAGVLGFGQFVSGGTGLYQLLAAYMLPGEPVANMYAAMYGNNPQVQAIDLLQDLKLGVYLKIPPRHTFLAQMLGTIVGAILNYVMAISILTEQREVLLSISGNRIWSGQNAQSYNSTAIAWGALGPQMFGAGKLYVLVPASLGIGLLLPVPFYLAWRFLPAQFKKTRTAFKKLNTAIICQYSCYMSVGINSSVMPSMVIGVFSQWFVRKRYPRAFTKYNVSRKAVVNRFEETFPIANIPTRLVPREQYLLAGALDGGTQVISFILNFAVFGAAGHPTDFPEWWGNDLSMSTDRCLLPPKGKTRAAAE